MTKVNKKWDKTLFEGVVDSISKDIRRVSTIAKKLNTSVFAVNSEIYRLTQVRYFNKLIKWDKNKDYVEICEQFKGTPTLGLIHLIKIWHNEDLRSGKKFKELEKDTLKSAGVLPMDYTELDKLMEEV